MTQKNKQIKRKEYRKIRKNIDGKKELSEIICERIKTLEAYQKTIAPAFYWAYGSEASLINICRERQNAGLDFFLPKCLNENGEMEFFEAKLDNFAPDCRNIPSPVSQKRILARDLDCIFVPALAFDIFGNRLGQGAGYYDRYLKKCVNAVKIGVCFSAQISEDLLDTDDLDVKMDLIVSEKGVIEC